jgi:Possible lysine decarboxylase
MSDCRQFFCFAMVAALLTGDGWDFLGQSLEDVCGWRWNARRTVRSDYPDSDPQDHKSFPVLIMGTDNWHEILRFIERMAKAGMIAPSDMQVVYVTDSVDDAIAHIRSHAIERFALLAFRRVRPHWRWLGERGLPPPGPPARRLPP